MLETTYLVNMLILFRAYITIISKQIIIIECVYGI